MIEICCNSLQSARNARQGGATRVELCHNLEVGGVTPTEEDIRSCVAMGLRTHVLVRPRGGDFCYGDAEYAMIKHQVARCKALGAHAVVVGFLHQDGSIDVERTAEIVHLAAPMEVTFHRAFDECANPLQALEQIIACGCHRILTSGCAPSALEGIPLLRQLVTQAAGRIIILAGAGVTPDNAAYILQATGVQEIHGSCKHTLPDGTIETDGILVEKLINQITENEK